MEEKLKEYTSHHLIEVAFHVFAIVAYFMYATIWPFYIVIGILTIKSLVVGLALSFMVSGVKVNLSSKNDKNFHVFLIPVNLIYLISCYQLHLLGYSVFSGIAAAYILSLLFGSIIKVLKNE